MIRLCAGMTSAKFTKVLAMLRPAELVMAMTKLRARRTPSNQAHVTNRLDDPLLLAADAATAAAFGFRELETTVPVLTDAPSDAVAVSIGSAVGAPGVLVLCSVEEALELERCASTKPFTEFQCFSVIRPLLGGGPRLTRAVPGAG
ncbi:propanediol/glycerol family dehydratase large subunit [Acrocarpospora sp. B8E8]|uniref:propanediol/glycerol family dehydratase large subunit n=1 Tax=Acrocarpospora sp. B8E8 TaxID=3153572 RepID=UPI00325EF914